MEACAWNLLSLVVSHHFCLNFRFGSGIYTWGNCICIMVVKTALSVKVSCSALRSTHY